MPIKYCTYIPKSPETCAIDKSKLFNFNKDPGPLEAIARRTFGEFENLALRLPDIRGMQWLLGEDSTGATILLLTSEDL